MHQSTTDTGRRQYTTVFAKAHKSKEEFQGAAQDSDYLGKVSSSRRSRRRCRTWGAPPPPRCAAAWASRAPPTPRLPTCTNPSRRWAHTQAAKPIHTRIIASVRSRGQLVSYLRRIRVTRAGEDEGSGGSGAPRTRPASGAGRSADLATAAAERTKDAISLPFFFPLAVRWVGKTSGCGCGEALGSLNPSKIVCLGRGHPNWILYSLGLHSHGLLSASVFILTKFFSSQCVHRNDYLSFSCFLFFFFCEWAVFSFGFNQFLKLIRIWDVAR